MRGVTVLYFAAVLQSQAGSASLPGRHSAPPLYYVVEHFRYSPGTFLSFYTFLTFCTFYTFYTFTQTTLTSNSFKQTSQPLTRLAK